MAKLGDFVKIKTGKLDANAADEGGKYPFFTCSKTPLRINNYSYDCECVLVAGNGDLNVKYYNGKFDAYQRTYVIEGKEDSQISIRYLYYFLDKYVETLRNQSIGGVIKYIKLGNLTEAPFPLMSLEIQKKVVSNLDKITLLIEKRTKQLNLLDELVKSRFVEMFGDPVSNPKGWEKVSLSNIAELKIGPFGSLLHKEDYCEGQHPVINPSHIVDGKIVFDEELTVNDSKYDELCAYRLQIGDVVLGRRGEMGRCAVVNSPNMLCGTGSLIIRPHSELRADFIQKIISFPTFKKTIEDMAVGQTMPNLNVPIVSNFQIIKPPVEVQIRYYDFVAQVDKSKLAVQKSLEQLEILKKSLMQAYFG